MITNISSDIEISIETFQKSCKYELNIDLSEITIKRINYESVKISYSINSKYYANVLVTPNNTLATFRFGGRLIKKEVDWVEMMCLMKVIQMFKK
jgi:hypothetical protein